MALRTHDDGGDGREWVRKMHPGTDFGIAREIYEVSHPNALGQKSKSALRAAADFFDREAQRCDRENKPIWSAKYRERAHELRQAADYEPANVRALLSREASDK